jgi:chromate transporter
VAADRRSHLGELARTFGRIGLTAFGGPAAHIGYMREEIVARRSWLTDAEYVDLIGAANLIPGPTSTEVALHVGHRRAGLPGLLVAGFAFVTPAVVISVVLAWAYVAYGARPEVGAIFAGVAPVVVAIVAHAGLALGRTAIDGPLPAFIAAGAIAASVAGVGELPILILAGVVAVVIRGAGRALTDVSARAAGIAWTPLAAATAAAASAAAASATPLGLFLVFLKIGALLFGSGYLLVAFLRSELVEGLGWITETQLVDAVAVGQVTPGPVTSTATFVGYLVAGLPGAAAATLGIFLPAFVLVALSAPLVARIRSSGPARDALDGVNAAALGLLAVVAVALGVGAVHDLVTGVLAIASFLLLVRGVSPVWLIAAGAVIGLARSATGF